MKVFYPLRFEDVPASGPHEVGTQYRVAFGLEHWGEGEAEYVYKVQMVYGGQGSGRRSPSFPEGSDDLERCSTPCNGSARARARRAAAQCIRPARTRVLRLRKPKIRRATSDATMDSL